MIDTFESTARIYPDRVFLTFVDAAGATSVYTYRRMRLVASTIARRLQSLGVRRGGVVAVDLPNCPEFVAVVLAAAYGSFTLVTLNQRLSDAEKMTRLLELEREGVHVAHRIDEESVKALMGHVQLALEGEVSVSGEAPAARRTIMGVKQDAIDDAVHFAEREAHVFDADANAVVMFTSGTTGRSKAVALTWRNLVGSANASMRALAQRDGGLWQAVLPFYHIGGLQVLVRSVVRRAPLLAYERFDAERVLADAQAYGATYVPVVDKMLQDMLAAERARKSCDRIAGYECILLGGGPLNPQTVERAFRAGARVYASYGMTETSSQIANALVAEGFTGGLKLLPGYSARIVDPDPDGFGRLAVRGPGVFGGYLNARAPFTVDGYFLTGDTAALYEGRIYVKERTADMFVSGGENVYPAEIAGALRRVKGVGDAHVFGVPDATWGRRPVAVVERTVPGLTSSRVRSAVSGKLSKLNMPESILVVDALPRMGIGKVDRVATEALFEGRLEARRIVLHRIRLPFRKPFKTAQKTLTHRDLIIVEVIDHAGRVGLGECVSFDTDWYLPETLGDDARYIEEVAAPSVIGRAFAHPRDVSPALHQLKGAVAHPMALCAIEMAFWDLFGRIMRRPLWRLVREEYVRVCERRGAAMPSGELPCAASVRGSSAMVAAGAVVGMGAPEQVVEQAHLAANAGYRRVKLKIAPGCGLEAVRAVREAFPSLLVTLDANGSFSMCDVDELRAYDELSVGWIEEPLDVTRPGPDGHRDAFARLDALQKTLSTPICIDESFVTAADALRMLRFRNLRCVAVKIAKFGGIAPAIDFIVRAQELGREVWMGGMYDTGVSKRMHAAFETLPGVIVPGDVGATSRYFAEDVTDPPYAATRGYVLLNGEGHEHGLGCDLNEPVLARVRVDRTVLE